MPPSDPLDPARAPALAQLPEPELRRELAALAEQGTAAGPLLQALADGAPDKGVRKLARAALHRLRAGGARIEVPRGERAESVLRPLEAEIEPALLTAPDAEGQQLALLALRQLGGGLLYHVLVSDTQGVLVLEVLEGTFRKARNALREMRKTAAPGTVVPVPVAEVAALARRAERASGRAAPLTGIDSEALAALFREAGPRTPGERLREELGARAAGLSVADAQATLDLRLDSGALVLWVFGGEEFEALARELAGIERSPLVLSTSQQRERQLERIEKFAESFFGERRRMALSERLEEMGAACWARADEDAAWAALRIAAHLREARRPLEISLVRRSFEGSLELLQNAAREQEADKLIVPG